MVARGPFGGLIAHDLAAESANCLSGVTELDAEPLSREV
jgi:hypothetical protein